MDPVPAELLDPGTPAEVVIGHQARTPETDPTLGVVVEADGSTAKHRLVAVGDSLTHGFQSLAIFNTDLAYPALIARELGWYEHFRHPEYPGKGGLPLNLEFILRQLEHEFDDRIHLPASGRAAFAVRDLINEIEMYWESGAGATVPTRMGINHNLGIFGWDLRDILAKTAQTEAAQLTKLRQGGETTMGLDPWRWGSKAGRYLSIASRIAAIRVLDSARGADGEALTPLEAAKALGEDGGIETLIVFIGANNALRAVIELGAPRWSGDDYADPDRKDQYTVWRPSHFLAEYRRVAEAVEGISAAHVIFCTVPHITIAPVLRGVGNQKMHLGSRYFDYYTRPWIEDDDFDPYEKDPFITGNQARAIDAAIDQYNDGIVKLVREGRQAGRDWRILDTAGLLDRMAYRRYVKDPAARPDWWKPYPLPPVLANLHPPPDSRFFATGAHRRTRGGLIALDGIHPTTVGYGLLAQEIIKVMETAGVIFRSPGGNPRNGPVEIDFATLVGRDTLMSDPPGSFTSDLKILGWLDQLIDLRYRLS
jgi:hypothetical protein